MNNVVINPYEYFADPTKGRPIFNGFVYIGLPDTDPEVPANQKQVYARLENGTDVAIPQPITTNAGGYPTYNGSVIGIIVDGSYSIKVNDKNGTQALYGANLFSWAYSNPNDLPVTATGTTAPRSLADRFGDVITPLDKGAVGDGVTDDTQALIDTISDGRPVDWLNLTYSVSGMLLFENWSKGINWVSSGAKIVLNSVATEESVIRFVSIDNNNTFFLQGDLYIDCNNLAQSGFMIRNIATNGFTNFPDEHTTVTISDLSVLNVRKTVTGVASGYINGDGISLIGAFRTINLVRPNVINVSMEAGSGVFGSHGITGITIADDNSGSQPQYIHIEDPYISHIVSEDDTHYADQDGIRIFTDRLMQPEHTKQSAKITGGTVINSRGRAVKCQTQMATINGLTIIRDSSIDARGTGLGDYPEIDFQTGGGVVRDIDYYYDGFAAVEMVRFNEDSTLRDQMFSQTVDGIKGQIFNSAGIPDAIVKPYADSTRNQFTCSISNIEVIGSVKSAIEARVASTGDINTAKIDAFGVYASCTETFVDLVSAGDCVVSLTSCHNTSGTDIPSFINDGGNTDQRVSTINCTGFSSVYKVIATEDQGNITRVDAIATSKKGNAGLVRPFTITIPAGGTGVLEKTGYQGGNCILIVNVARGGGAGADSGMFSVVNGASGDVYDMSGGLTGGRFSIGNGASDPAGSPNDYVMWVSSDSSTGVSIRNTTANERVFVGVMIG